MKRARIRLLPLLLAGVMLLSLPVPAAAAEDGAPVTGSISATVRIDYAQLLGELERRDIRVRLGRDGASLGEAVLTAEGSWDLGGGITARTALRSGEGAPLDGGQWPGYLDVTFTGLPRGSYTLTFTGEGYRTYTTGAILLQDYARQVTLGTGDATFTLGDVDGDGAVTPSDREAVAGALETALPAELARCDLNGDGRVDIVDLAYVNRLLTAQGEAEYRETALLQVPARAEDIEQALAAEGTRVQSGDLSGLFGADAGAVCFAASADSIVIPLPLSRSVDTSEIEIVTPVGAGGMERGFVEVETEEDTVTVPFDHTLPAGVRAVSRTGENRVITVDLGRRTAVKKVTITVTKTEGGYAAVETVRFLRDIVPENPAPPNSTIKGLAAVPGDGQAALRWQALPNVSGYLVRSWPRSAPEQVRELRTTVSSAAVTGLENLTEYAFTVTPTDGGWTGRTSQPVYATPQPARVPAPPDMITVSPLDSALSVSWKRSENATYYRLFYQVKGAADWTQAGETLTGTGWTITGLVNDTAYSVCLVAGNSLGESGRSRIAEGTPRGVENKRPEGIPEAALLSRDKIAGMELADPGNVDRSAYTDSRPWSSENMWDGDYTTHWTAAGWTRNEHVVTTFTQPVNLTAAFWVPRLDGAYPSYIRAYSVRVWYAGEDPGGPGHLIVPDPERGGQDNGGTGQDVHTWPNVSNYGAAGSGVAADRFALMPFGPVENVVKISIAAEQRDYLRVSLSELLFMEYDPAHSLPAEINALFEGGGDGLHTRLAAGVEQGTIDALKARLDAGEGKYYLHPGLLADELALAESLLRGEAPGVLLTGIDSRDGGADSRTYQQGGSTLQPLGAAAAAGTEITVYAAGIPAGETVTVYASQYNAEANAWLASAGEIQNGRNILTIPKIGSQNTPRGGSLYLSYAGPEAEGISLHLRRAADIPLLDLSDWYDMDDTRRTDTVRAYVEELTAYAAGAANPQTDWRNVTEIAAPTVLLSLPASAALAGLGSADTDARVRQLMNSVLAWEDLMHICKTAQGIDRTYGENDMQSRQNIRCMQMFSGAFMYAAGSHIGIGYGSCSGMVGGTPLRDLPAGASANGLFGWGIAHEIGHNMDKLGKAEITNNIYAILVQTFDGAEGVLPSRLEKSGKYASVFTKTAQALPGASGDVFTQLGMYWQLHLAYDSGDPLDFYNRFFKAWKAGTYTRGFDGLSYDERVALTAAGTAGRDLNEFFRRWGMTLGAGVREEIASYDSEERAVWYLSDQSRRDRLAGAEDLSGSFTAAAVLAEGENNRVTLTIDGAGLTGSLQGYEILRNGQSIDFVVPDAGGTDAVYTDLIGSANHRVFDYAVVAYSTLGTALDGGRPTEAGSVRIAYDAVLDPDDYTAAREGDTVTLTLREETAVSGLKLTGDTAALGGGYTVTVTDGGGRATVAKDGAYDPAQNEARDDRDCYLLYFNKPGVQDTRIWTYDAGTITVTNVPEGVEVLPVGYAGDDVAFLPGGAVGLLAADYDLGGGEKLARGTLVITGTYRGDPLYNYAAVRGLFATVPDENGENEVVEREVAGDCYLFAEIPADGAVSDISDGIFLFVPNLKEEEALQGIIGNCGAESLLPGQMRLLLYRTDKPNDTSSQRVTAETLWLTTPGGDTLPEIKLEGDV